MMQNLYDYKKYIVLYVDDEEKSLKYFSRAFADEFRILTATNAAEGLQIFEANRDQIAVLMTDQRMPGEKGVQLLEKARQISPRAIRILATAYSDLDAAIDAVNTGAIYKYVTKPWDIPQLETTLKRGIEFFIVQHERDQLMREKLSVLHNMMITDRVVSLGVMAAGLSHHLRNPLVAVRTFLDLAPAKMQEEKVTMDELRNPNFWRDFYDHVRTQVERISAQLDNLGLLSANSGAVQPVNLGELVTEAVAALGPVLAAQRITVTNKVPGNLPAMTTERPQLVRMLQLLLQETIAQLGNGGQITLSAEPQDNGIKLVVEDDGPGLPAEALRRVFDPFFARSGHPEDFGINLMAFYFLAYHLGGRVRAESRNPKGAKFTLTFPLEKSTAVLANDDRDFINKVLLNDALWEKLLSGE
ncbi:MAG: hupR1 2 [Verrucomicrobia bacterium]|jgi:two-component system probable response regulator PhcQ|nr:hupR1 2 [Verrucomicrobiota bacterium]